MNLAFLSPLYERPGPWASVYMDTTLPSQDAAARQELTARSVCDRLHDQGADAATCRTVYQTLDHLPRTGQPPGQAVFATDGEVVLQTPLTAPPPGGPTSCWEALPHVGPLPALSGGDPSCLVAHVDRTGADLELRRPQGVQAMGTVHGEDWPVHRTPSADPSEHHFQTAVENTWEQNAASVAEALRARADETGAELLVLAGDRRACRAVHDKLPPPLRDRTVEAEHGTRAAGGNVEAGKRKLDDEVAEARAAHGRRHTADAMERFRAGRVPTADGQLSAAEGVPSLIEAAREHRIAALLVRPEGADLHREVWVGDEPDQVAVRRTETQYLGDPQPASARADDALLRSACTTDAEVLHVPENGAGAGTPDGPPVGGLGALLRWPYGGAPEGGGIGGGQHTAGQ